MTTLKLSGVTFNDRQKTLATLAMGQEYDFIPQFIIEHQKNNPYDKNAVLVSVMFPKGEVEELGFIPKDFNQQLATLLDANLQPIYVTNFRIYGGENGKNYGVSITLNVEI